LSAAVSSAWSSGGEPPRLALLGGFFLTGIFTALLGQLLPELSSRLSLTPRQAGWLLATQFAASSLASVLSTRALGQSLVRGYACLTAGVAALALAGWPSALGAVAVLGLGIGFAIPPTNLIVAQRSSAGRGAALSTLNLLWGLGAVSCPLILAGTLHFARSQVVLALFAALAAAVCLRLAAWRRRSPKAHGASRHREAGGRAAFGLHALLALKLGLYVGVEAAVGGWIVSLATPLVDGRGAALMIGACFWGALLGGRAAAPLLLRRVTEAALHWSALAIAGAGALLLLAAPSAAVLRLAAVLTGFGLAPIFPLTVSVLASSSERSGARHAGWVFASAGAGAALLPWLVGRVASEASLQAGFAVPAAGIGAMAALLAVLQYSSARSFRP
jgi:fucose permease